MFSEENPRRLAQIALVVLLIIGCIAVLLPFIGAVLFAFVVWACTWPYYSEKLLPRLGGRDALGATLMTLLLVLIMLLPMVFLAASLANGADRLIDFAKPYVEQGLPLAPPPWLSGLPFIGVEIDHFWHQVASNRDELNALLKQMVAPLRQLALALGGIAANGLLQLAL
ncbi:MAG TPA: AI-2E family transporter, partial [Azonexus sp.]|nr:AI-2E family transporter [Azonexus sp.]